MSSLEMDPLKKDFRNFMYKVWMSLFGNAPSNRLYEFGERLQKGPDRDILMGFRGMAKSYTTVTFADWTLYCDPTEIVLTTSGSGDGASGNADLAFFLINNLDFLAHMKPKGLLRKSAEAFDVTGSLGEKSESFAALSLFGQITGRRASLIIPDDVETPNTSATEGDRTKLRARYAELGGAVLKPGGRIKVLGTPQHELTIYTELATEKGYSMRIWPALYPRLTDDPKTDEGRKYGSWLAPSIREAVEKNPHLAGLSTEPGRFSEADLEARKLEYGLIEFARQFLLWLDIGTGTGKPLKLKDIPVIEVPLPVLAGVDKQGMGVEAQPLKVPARFTWSPLPANRYPDLSVDSLPGDGEVYAPSDMGDWAAPDKVVLIVDPSGQGKDETAWGVLTGLAGRVGLVHMDASLDGFGEETLKSIALDAKVFGVQQIIIEKNYGGGMFGALLKPHLAEIGYPCTVIEENAGTAMKEVRIVDTLQPVITTHRLWIAAHVLRGDFPVDYPQIERDKRRFYRLTYQLTRMEKLKNAVAHDDRVDMLAAGVATFMGALRQQLHEAGDAKRAQWLEEEAEKIRETLRKQANLRATGQEELSDKLLNFLKGTEQGLLGSVFFRGRAKQ